MYNFDSISCYFVIQDMRISSACFEEIKDKLEKFNIPQETTEKLSQLVVDDNKRFGQRGTQEFVSTENTFFNSYHQPFLFDVFFCELY